jgi:hypothetical protein
VTDEPKKISPPRNYFRRREQLRLLVMVMSLGLVVVLINEARKPENWHWLTGEGAEPAKPATNSDNIDTTYQPEITPEVPLDEFRISPDVNDEAEAAAHLFPGVVPAYLEVVEDNRPHHPHEAMAWYNLWEVLSINDTKLINGASTGEVSFVELFEQPEAYRGELVTIVGTVKRAEWIGVGENTAKIDGYYKLILRMKNGPSRPVFLYVLNLPDTFPQGDKLNQDIVVTAFFYKNWPYPGQYQEYIAPVLLARDFEWIRAEETVAWTPTVAQMLGIAFGGAIFAAGLAYIVYLRSRRMFDAAGAAAAHASQASVAQLNELEAAPTVAEQLKELAEKQ